MAPIDRPSQLVTIYIILLREIFIQNQVTKFFNTLITFYIQDLIISILFLIRYKESSRMYCGYSYN